MNQPKVQSIENFPAGAGDESWTVPEDWIGEKILWSIRGSWLLTNQGPVLINSQGTLIADLGSSLVVREDEGNQICVPKCNIQQIIRPGSIVTGGLPPLGGVRQ